MKSHYPGCELDDRCTCQDHDDEEELSQESEFNATSTISFHLPIVPPKATSQTAGRRMAIINGRPMFFKNKKAASAEHDYLTLCSPHRPDQPIAGPVRLRVAFVFPWRKSEPKRRLALGSVPMTSKPDLSNAIKSLEDCLTKLGFWDDDGQVADLSLSKHWGDQVGITIEISEIKNAGGLGRRPRTPI